MFINFRGTWGKGAQSLEKPPAGPLRVYDLLRFRV